MIRLPLRLILVPLIVCLGNQSFSQSFCAHLFYEPPLYRHLKLHDSNFWSLHSTDHAQEILWDIQRQGEPSQALNLELMLRHSLEKLSDLKQIPAHWELISTDSNLNNVFLGSIDGIPVVVKFSERSHQYEALVSQIATLLSIPVPFTVSIEVGDKLGVAQIYMTGWQSLADSGPMTTHRNLLLEFFDRVVANGDINRGNVLVRENPLDQVGIDYEFAFEARDPYQIIGMGPNAWLLENIVELSEQFPEAFSKLRDPLVRDRIYNLVLNSKIDQSELFAEHVRLQLRTVENVARLLVRD